jgi:hypothetical protein
VLSSTGTPAGAVVATDTASADADCDKGLRFEVCLDVEGAAEIKITI